MSERGSPGIPASSERGPSGPAAEQPRAGRPEPAVLVLADGTAFEGEAISLIQPGLTQEERAQVYSSVAFMYANDGMKRPEKVVEFATTALSYPVAESRACQLYKYLGEANERLERRSGPITQKGRRRILGLYIRGLRRVWALKQVDEIQPLPPVGRYDYSGPTTDTQYQEIVRQHDREVAARERAVAQNDLLRCEASLVAGMAALFPESSGRPEAIDGELAGWTTSSERLRISKVLRHPNQ
jgi:hypothetical protein